MKPELQNGFRDVPHALYADSMRICRKIVVWRMFEVNNKPRHRFCVIGLLHVQAIRSFPKNAYMVQSVAFGGSTEIAGKRIGFLVTRRLADFMPKVLCADGASTNNYLMEERFIRDITHTEMCFINDIIVQKVPVYVSRKPTTSKLWTATTKYSQVLKRLLMVDTITASDKQIWDVSNVKTVGLLPPRYGHGQDTVAKLRCVNDACKLFKNSTKQFVGKPFELFKLLDELMIVYNSPEMFKLSMPCVLLDKLDVLLNAVSQLKIKKHPRSKNDLHATLATTKKLVQLMINQASKHPGLKVHMFSLQLLSSFAPEDALPVF